MDYIEKNTRVDIAYIRDLVSSMGYMRAAKILSESLDKNVEYTYVAGVLYALSLQEKAVDMHQFVQEKSTLFNPLYREFFLAHYEALQSVIDHTRDFGYQFAAVKTIAKNYLFKYKGEPIESIQWAWMRVAIQVAAPLEDWRHYSQGKDVLREVIATYNILSQREGIHATPTCINAGYSTPQLESCFLVRIGDNMLSIADVQKLLLVGSKCNGGFGVFVGDIRHSRVANRGITKGVIGLAKVINGLVPYADQLGSRPMAVNLILPIWHCDTPTFITMKDENAPLDVRATQLNYTVSIPDLFYQRCLEGGNWSLFCPRECKIQWVKEHGGDPDNTHEIDAAPSLCDVWGDKFVEYYLMCERAGIVKQVMKARDLDAGLNTYRAMIGEPYRLNIDNVNRKSNQKNLGTLVQTNLCVHGSTLILTDKGYIPIQDRVDKETVIWNGFEWSTVTPKMTGEDQHLLTVRFSNGSTLKCTDYHKFYTKESYSRSKTIMVEARHLRPGMKLIKCDYPIVNQYDEDTESMFKQYAYTHGFFCGDGTYCTGRPYVRLYGEKEKLLEYLNIRGEVIRETGEQERICCKLPFEIPPKFTIPMNASIDTKLRWLEGYVDADGCVTKCDKYDTIQVSSINIEFIDGIKLLLQTLGCDCKYSLMRSACKKRLPKNNGSKEYGIYDCKDIYRMTISTKNLKTLYNLGFKPKRLQFNISDGILTQKDTSRYITIESVMDEGEYADTYCFTEPKRHMGIFNGIITGQCTEILQYTCAEPSGPHGEMAATCDLATINVASLVRYTGKNTVIDWKRLEEITRQFVRNLDRVLDRTSGILPNEGEKEIDSLLSSGETGTQLREMLLRMKKNIQRDPTYNARQKTRAIGIGIMGLASLFALLGIEYGSKESMEIGARIRAAIYMYSLDESCLLASEKGSYPLFEGSPLSQGILTHDMWAQEDIERKSLEASMEIAPSSIGRTSNEGTSSHEMHFSEFVEPDYVQAYKEASKRYTWKEIDPSLFGSSLSWDDLRTKVRRGVRNSLLTCQMPNATTSGAFGVSASIEPFYEVYFTTDNANGKDTTIYDALRDVFLVSGLYDPEKIASYLYQNKGRIDGLSSVFPEESKDKVKALEKLFPHAFRINKKKYLLFIQYMGRYIDQAQSTNIFFDKPNASYLARLSYMNWINGASTEYYVRRLAGTEKVDPFMDRSSKDIPLTNINQSTPLCRRDNPDCVSCQ